MVADIQRRATDAMSVAELSRDLIYGSLRHVDCNDMSTLGMQPPDTCCTDTAAGPSNDHGPVFKAIHVSSHL
jgi:hypothetical protein